MPKLLKILLLILGAVFGLLLLAAVVLSLWLDLGPYKPRIEAAASEASGMEVRIAGRIGVGFFPGLHVTLRDVQVRNRDTDLFAVRKAYLGVDLRALLGRRVQVQTLALDAPRLNIERDREGRFNFETNKPDTGPLPEFGPATLTVSDATLRYTDRQTGQTIEAADCRLDVRDLHLARGVRADVMKDVSLAAELACGSVRTKERVVSDVALTLAGKHGLYELDPITLRSFEGHGAGRVRADFTGDVPSYQLRYALTQFRIDAALKSASGQRAPEGTADFTAELGMRGKTAKELKRSLQGRVSLRGKDLVLHGVDLDASFDRFEVTQSFNLIDVGAIFLAGPIGLAVTKGHDFASILKGLKGRSEIRTLVSDWSVARGVLQAQDVAIATQRHRVALQGRLDLVDERFDGVTMALVDAQGCAKVQQKIRGSFAKPEIDKPSTLTALAGSVVKLFRSVLPGKTCEVFYTGSVAAPQ